MKMDKQNKSSKYVTPQKVSETEESVASPSKPRTRGKKRKRHDSGSSSDSEQILPENALEVEKNLQNVALKNNLDDASMKKILKKVVTNDHVLALVKLREEEEIALSKEQNPKPKLTRSKAKELMGASPKSAPWNLELTPIKHIPVKTRPEVEALITKELPEDEDDDEYEPTHDDVPSDDDQTLESCSDVDSQPATPGAPLTPQSARASPLVVTDGPFKVPQSDDDQTLESCSDVDSQPATPGAPLTPQSARASPLVVTDGPFKVPQSDDDQTLESCSDVDSQPATPGAPLTPQSARASPLVVTDGPFKVPQSDDDQTLESCSDVDSQPATPGAPLTPQSERASPLVVTDGPFKVPQSGVSTPARRKLVIVEEEEATIALRTRSRINLSATPIEHIESSFVPPDDVPMPIGDDLWNQFLEECLNPAEMMKNEDDDEADPEYNVAADPDANDEDEDNLDNSILRISKKELNDLVTELFSIMPEDPAASEELAGNLANNVLTGNNEIAKGTWEGKQEPLSDEERPKQSQNQPQSEPQKRFPIGEDEDDDDISEQEDPDYNPTEKENTKPNKNRRLRRIKGSNMISISVEEQDLPVQSAAAEVEPPPLLKTLQANITEHTVNIDASVKMLPEQVLILQQQLRQHVQLCTSNYLQLYVNPTHWAKAPPYKEYLEQLNKMVEANPNSVADVCNLKPALELVKGWESSVSQDTPENKAMVEYVQSEAERSRRRFAQNALYVGNFPDMYMKVIANSTVFQYPYLLPAMPYRADNNRKFSYRKPEDELIVLGLDQFWQYVEENPEMFKRPKAHNAKRWGLVAACNLMCKYMFPWQSSRWLQYHVHRAKTVKGNPIQKFFANREVTKVEHRLLPFNPKLTLYEQPEPEMPRLWLRYLAKTSKRFRYYYYKRSGTGLPPAGVAVSVDVQEPKKNPLPPDFTRTIVCNRYNVKPKVPEISQDNFDMVIAPNAGPMLTINPLTATNTNNFISSNPIEMGISRTGSEEAKTKKKVAETNRKVAIPNLRSRVNNENTANVLVPGTIVPVPINKLVPVTCTQNTTDNNTPPANPNVLTVVQTIHGAYLIPLNLPIQNTNTVNSINFPIPSTNVQNNLTQPSIVEDNLKQPSIVEDNLTELSIVEENNVTKSSMNNKSTSEEKNVNAHCQCCVLLKKICKEKQSRITDFFKAKKSEKKPCECSHRKFPKITKRLRMLINNYKSKSWCEQRRIKSMLDSADKERKKDEQQQSEKDEECSLEDIEYVATYHMKVTRRSALARNVYLKTRINEIFSKFDPDVGNPVVLSETLFEAFDVEMVDLYKEFMGFLTPEQAEKVDKFKDYFVHSCIGGLVKRVEAEIDNRENRDAILSQLNSIFSDNVSTSCEICTGILNTLTQYPRLAKHVFSLFPHRVVEREKKRFEPVSTEPQHPINKLQSKLNALLKPQSVQPTNSIQTELQTESQSHDRESEELITAARLEQAEPVDNLTICDETLVVMEFEADEHSSNENRNTSGIATEESKNDVTMTGETDEIKDEDALTSEIIIEEAAIEESIINKTETHDTSESTLMSPLVMSEDEQEAQIKTEITEAPEWTKDEDKFILQLLLEHVPPDGSKDKNILEILEERNVYQIIAAKYPNKCVEDVKVRVMRILDILVVSEY